MPSSTPRWRYGVALFPLVPLAALVNVVGYRAFLEPTVHGPGGETSALAAVLAFLLSSLVSIAGVVAALVVLAALVLDARALRRGDAGFSPRPAFAGFVGLVHLAAWVLASLYVVSMPPLAYYTYRRFT